MIVSKRDEKLLIVRQTDHAFLSGQLARAWGNATFQTLEPFDSAVLAAEQHDNGWKEWEDEPRVNPETRLPYQFTELPASEHLTLYLRGVERAIERDLYAGLLVSMHCRGLYNQRFGLQPGMPAKENDPEVLPFMRKLEAQQVDLRARLQEQSELSWAVEEQRLWANYKLLQIFDLLSLYLCIQPLRRHALRPVPIRVNDGDIEIQFRPKEREVIELSPFPFAAKAFAVAVPARLIGPGPYASDQQLREELNEATALPLEFALVSDGG